MKLFYKGDCGESLCPVESPQQQNGFDYSFAVCHSFSLWCFWLVLRMQTTGLLVLTWCNQSAIYLSTCTFYFMIVQTFPVTTYSSIFSFMPISKTVEATGTLHYRSHLRILDKGAYLSLTLNLPQKRAYLQLSVQSQLRKREQALNLDYWNGFNAPLNQVTSKVSLGNKQTKKNQHRNREMGLFSITARKVQQLAAGTW